MKRRVFKVLNFFAFNLLFFALYLNFIHKDNNATPTTPVAATSALPPAQSIKGTVLVDNPGQYLKKEEGQPVTAKKFSGTEKASFN